MRALRSGSAGGMTKRICCWAGGKKKKNRQQ